MDPSTLNLASASTVIYLVLTLLLYGVHLGKHMVIVSFLCLLIIVLAGSAAKALNFDVLRILSWFLLVFCGCVLAGGVIYRAVQVYEYFKARKNSKTKSTVAS